MTTNKEFFAALYQHTPDPEHLYVAWGAPNAPTYLTVEELLGGDWLADLPDNRDWYFTPGVLKATRRLKTNVLGAGVVWIDLDNYKDAVEPLLPPTFRVSSGRGQHLYYVLDSFYSASDIELVNKNLLVHVNRPSEGTHDSTRILRVPGTNNCKYLKQDQYPEYTEPLACEVLEQTGYTYSLDDLRRLQPYEPDLLTMPTNGSGKVDRSRRDWAVCSRLKEWGLQRYALEQFLLYYSDKGKERPIDYIRTTLDKLFDDKEGKPATTPQAKSSFFNALVESVARLYDDQNNELGIVLQLSWDDQQRLLYATQNDFKSSSAVNAWLTRNKVGNRIFTGGDKHAKLTFTQLVARVPDNKMLLVETAGRHELPDGTRLFIYSRRDTLVHPDSASYGVFMQPKIEGLPTSYLKLDPAPLAEADAQKLLGLVQQVQTPEVIQPALGWLALTPFQPYLWRVGGMGYPVLHLFGAAGSGKTTLAGSVLLPLLGCFTTAFASAGTYFGLMANLTMTNGWPVWFGEYKESNHNSDVFKRLLRENYDREIEARGRPDQTMTGHLLTSPAIVDGESPFTGGANLERTLSLQLLKQTVEIDSPAYLAYNELAQIDKEVWQRFAHSYLSWTITKDFDYIWQKLSGAMALFKYTVKHPRLLRLVAVAFTGLLVLQDFVKDQKWNVEIQVDPERFDKSISLLSQGLMGVKTEADDFVQTLMTVANTAMPQLIYFFDQENDVAWFNLTSAYRLLRMRTGLDAMEMQLQDRSQWYVEGPKIHNGGKYYGVNVTKAAELGLDVPRPIYTGEQFGEETRQIESGENETS